MNKKKMMSCLALSILCMSSCAKKTYGVTSNTSSSSTSSSSNIIICNHTYGNWKMIKEPTSITTGEIKRKCSDCDNEETFILPILNETDYSYSLIRESTCTTEGLERYTYLKDGDKFDIDITLEVDIFNHVASNDDGKCFECEKFVAIEYEYQVNTCTVKKVGSLDENNLVHSLRHLVIPKTVTHNGQVYTVTGIEHNAFYFNINTQSYHNKKSLRTVDIQAEITELYDTFFHCESLEKVTLPNTLKTLENYAFNSCKSLKSIDLPESIETISQYAFNECSSLTSIYIPAKVNDLGVGGFVDCSSLEKIEVDPSNTKYTSLDDDNNECNAIIEKETKTLVIGCKNTKIPESIEIIGFNAFRGQSQLTEINIPDNVTTINFGAFSDCSALKEIYIPKNVTDINKSAFSTCPALEKIVVDKDNTVYKSIDSKGNNCDVIVKDTTLIRGCKNSVIFEGITSIFEDALRNCTQLESIKIPSTITSISGNIFQGCLALKNIEVDENNSVYDSRDNCNAIVETTTNTLAYGCKNTTVPSTIKIIGSNAFSNCSTLESIELPEGVEEIGVNAFYGCSSLKSIKLPTSVTRICSNAFSGCSALESIEIPRGVTNIDMSTFANCSSLKTVTFLGVPYIGICAFRNCTSLESIELPNGITTIAGQAFEGCSSLKYLHIPNSVTNLSENITRYCSSLEYVIIPTSITTVSKSTFGTATENIFVNGTKEDTSAELKNTLGQILSYYSEDEPDSTSTDSYWHYVDGKPVKW